MLTWGVHKIHCLSSAQSILCRLFAAFQLLHVIEQHLSQGPQHQLQCFGNLEKPLAAATFGTTYRTKYYYMPAEKFVDGCVGRLRLLIKALISCPIGCRVLHPPDLAWPLLAGGQHENGPPARTWPLPHQDHRLPAVNCRRRLARPNPCLPPLAAVDLAHRLHAAILSRPQVPPNLHLSPLAACDLAHRLHAAALSRQ